MGTIQTFQVLENGISKPVFYAYVKDRGLDQVAHGVYVSPDTWTDAIYILHLRCSQAVFSHETALFFHDLTDREPLKYSITVKTGYNPSRLQEDGFQVYTVKKDLKDVLWDALVATAKKRGTLEQIEAEEIGEVFDEIQSSPVMENLWKAYQRNYSYADDLSWHTVMDAVRVLYQTVYAEGNGTHD